MRNVFEMSVAQETAVCVFTAPTYVAVDAASRNLSATMVVTYHEITTSWQ